MQHEKFERGLILLSLSLWTEPVQTIDVSHKESDPLMGHENNTIFVFILLDHNESKKKNISSW